MNKLSDFKLGDKVRLTGGVLHKEYAGRAGVVAKTIKRRNMVKVDFDDGAFYEAFPQNVEHMGGA